MQMLKEYYFMMYERFVYRVPFLIWKFKKFCLKCREWLLDIYIYIYIYIYASCSMYVMQVNNNIQEVCY